jgi:hypothetical protein
LVGILVRGAHVATLSRSSCRQRRRASWRWWQHRSCIAPTFDTALEREVLVKSPKVRRGIAGNSGVAEGLRRRDPGSPRPFAGNGRGATQRGSVIGWGVRESLVTAAHSTSSAETLSACGDPGNGGSASVEAAYTMVHSRRPGFWDSAPLGGRQRHLGGRSTAFGSSFGLASAGNSGSWLERQAGGSWVCGGLVPMASAPCFGTTTFGMHRFSEVATLRSTPCPGRRREGSHPVY